jgi:aspartokinase
MNRKRLMVMKFGGTSVRNAARFRQCAAIVGEAARHHPILAVRSTV